MKFLLDPVVCLQVQCQGDGLCASGIESMGEPQLANIDLALQRTMKTTRAEVVVGRRDAWSGEGN